MENKTSEELKELIKKAEDVLKSRKKIEEIEKNLSELDIEKWDIYTEKPNRGEKYYCTTIDVKSWYQIWIVSELAWHDNSDICKRSSEYLILHKNEGSIDLEINFRTMVSALKKDFEPDKENWFLVFNTKSKDIELCCSTEVAYSQYCFEKDGAERILRIYPKEIIKTVLFGIKENRI